MTLDFYKKNGVASSQTANVATLLTFTPLLKAIFSVLNSLEKFILIQIYQKKYVGKSLPNRIDDFAVITILDKALVKLSESPNQQRKVDKPNKGGSWGQVVLLFLILAVLFKFFGIT